MRKKLCPIKIIIAYPEILALADCEIDSINIFYIYWKLLLKYNELISINVFVGIADAANSNINSCNLYATHFFDDASAYYIYIQYMYVYSMKIL